MPPFLKPLANILPQKPAPMPAVPTSYVELRPTFKPKKGKYDEFKSFCKERFVGGMITLAADGRKGPEGACTQYNFVENPEKQLFICREGYTDAKGLLQHLKNVDKELKEAQEMADIVDLTVTGPQEELDSLKDELKDLNPTYYCEI